MKAFLFFCLLFLLVAISDAQSAWQANLDSKVRFYQTTDFGIVLAGTDRSLYAIDGQTGERLWRRATGKIEETAIAPVPDTDLILLSRDEGSRSRLEAVDLISGAGIWRSEKVKGDVLQLAVDPANDLIAVVLVKNPRGDSGSQFKRKPVVHVLQLSTGNELWKRELDGEIEMMPARFGENLGENAYTLDNYRPPLLLDGRLFLFYEGATSYDARSGKEKEREKFKVNEDGLALTEADPVFDGERIYISGRGRIRAVNRRTGSVEWKADDVGNAAEMALIGSTLFIRTGGQFTRLKDGEIETKGPFGVSAIDVRSGETSWRYKGADKGLTNFVFADANTILIADRDDLITIDTKSGKRIDRFEHKVEKAQFVLINERGDAIVGGRDEIAAFRFRIPNSRFQIPNQLQTSKIKFQTENPSGIWNLESGINEVWRVKHKAPSRGAFRIVAGIALRATALYFRYGGIATSAIGLARGGLNLAGTVNSFRWSGLKSRFGSFDLTTLASNSARNYVTRRVYSYGSFARTPGLLNRVSGLQVITPSNVRGSVIGSVIDRATPSRAEVQENIFDRLDPVRQVERLSDYLLRRKRLAELRGNFMYFFTDLPRPYNRKGLVGVNLHDGRDGRFVLVSDPDPRFITDEASALLYSADGTNLQAFQMVR